MIVNINKQLKLLCFIYDLDLKNCKKIGKKDTFYDNILQNCLIFHAQTAIFAGKQTWEA